MRTTLVVATAVLALTACNRLRSDPSGDASSGPAIGGGASGADCVAGVWAQTSQSLTRVAHAASARGIQNATCSVATGGTKLVLNANHTGAETYERLQIVCTGDGIEDTGTTDGALSFTWAATGDQLAITATGSTAVNHQRITAHGHTIQQNVPIPSVGSSAHYTCSGDHLHLDYTVGGNTEPRDYARAAGP